MKDDGWKFLEKDDPRTETGELIPDCEREDYEVKGTSRVDSDEHPVLEYLGEFKALIDACGQVSYYFNMRDCIKANVNKAKVIASAYNHDLQYYEEQLAEWRMKGRRSFRILSLYMDKIGYEKPNEKEFLNSLAISKDRREAYKGYLTTCLNNMKTLSPAELETKYQQRLVKRLMKANKK